MVLALCLAGVLSTVGGQESVDWRWPEFRGPGTDGQIRVEGDYPWEWGAEKNVEWKTEVPGNGWSSPVIQGDVIVVTSAVPSDDGYDLAAMAYRESDGAMVWERKIFTQAPDAPGIHRKNSHASPTPLIDDRGDRVFVHFGHQGTACLSMKDGEILWKTRAIQYSPVHGNGGSPVLVENNLIFSCDGANDPFVVALDADTGAEKWRTPRSVDARKKFSFCTGLVTEIAGRLQVVLPGSDMVAGYDPGTGEEIWKVGFDGYSVVPRPIHEQGLIFISTGYDRPSLLAIDPIKKSVVWETSRSIAKTPSFLVVDGLLYNLSDNGILSCFEATSGDVVYTERLKGDFSSSPLLLNGRIYCTSESGLTTVFTPGREFRKLAENDLGERTLASLAVGSHGRIIYRSAGHLFSIRSTR